MNSDLKPGDVVVPRSAASPDHIGVVRTIIEGPGAIVTWSWDGGRTTMGRGVAWLERDMVKTDREVTGLLADIRKWHLENPE